MKNIFKSRFFSLVLFTALFSGIDQITKFYILEYFASEDNGIFILLPFLNFDIVWNYGISFGMLSDLYQGQFLLMIMAFIIISIMIFWFYIDKSLYFMPFSMIIGGAIGNMIDRIIHGGVLDFIDFYIKDWHYPAFNIADSFVVIGCLILIYQNFSKSKIKKDTCNLL